MQFKTLDSGIAVPYTFTRKPKRPTAFDFFCGAGGFGLGIIQAGFEVVGANEFDGAAALTYMCNLGSYPINIHYIEGEKDKQRLNAVVERCWGLKNKEQRQEIQDLSPDALKKVFGHGSGLRKPDRYKTMLSGSGWISHHPDVPPVRNFWFGDVRKLKGKEILDALGMKQGDLDLVTGGPPCQGYSRAGKQDPNDPRNTLVYEYARMIVELQPKTFVMEEVPDVVDFIDADGFPVLDRFCMLLQDGGYGRWDILKKSLMQQAGTAAGIKSTASGSGKRPGNRRPKPAPPDPQEEQISLF